MNFYGDKMYKIGNVELKLIVDRKGEGDMLLFKTVKSRGFVFVVDIIAANAFNNIVHIRTKSGVSEIGCDCEDTAQKVLDVITAASIKVICGPELATYKLERIVDSFQQPGDGECESCAREDCEHASSKCSCNDEEKDFNDFMSGFFERMSKAVKGEK